MIDVIKFYNGDENKTVLETQDYEESIFKEQYAQALGIFERICKDQEAFKADGTSDKFYDNSNIIAFCGDRGEGKTSCLRTVRHLLSTGTKEDDRNKVKTLSFSADTTPFPCYQLDMVDPAFFDKKHNLIELVLGQMYGKVVKDDIEKNENVEKSRRKDLMIRFQKAKQCLAYLEKERKELYDDLEELSVLAASTELRKEIANLFEEFCRYTKSKKLIIAIDDLDLNMTNGYNMAEEMRKYLCNEHCVLLVALKVEQLVEVVKRAIAREMQVGKDCEVELFTEMAAKYVVKLIPQSNRILMPTIKKLCWTKLLVLSKCEEVTEQRIKDALPVCEYVVRLIYKKTGYVFYNIPSPSLVVPRNLRALRHLIAKLLSLTEDYKDSKGNDIETNREFFKSYMLSVWAKCLNSSDYNFINNLSHIDDLSIVNKTVVDYLYKENKDLFENTQQESLCREIIASENNAHNVSVGDVLFLLLILEKDSSDQNVKNLVFYLKAMYSFLLYACYNESTIDEQHLFPQYNQDASLVNIYKEDEIFANTNVLQRLVNGSLFSYPKSSLLATNSTTSRSCDIGYIHIGKLREYASAIGGISSFEDIDSLSEDLQRKFKCIELVALCTRTFSNSEAVTNGEIDLRRKTLSPVYLGPISEYKNFLIVDVLEPFTSLLNVKYAYSRFNDILGFDLYSVAIKSKESLLYQMMKESYDRRNKTKLTTKFTESKIDKRKWEALHSLISESAIRIVDVQMSILNRLMFIREIEPNKSRGDVAYKYKKLYSDIIKINMKLYPRENALFQSTAGWELKFSPFKVLSQFLNEDENAKLFNQIFDEPINEKEIGRRNAETEEYQEFINFLHLVTHYDLPARGRMLIEQMCENTLFSSPEKEIFEQLIKRLIRVSRLYETESDLFDMFMQKSMFYLLYTRQMMRIGQENSNTPETSRRRKKGISSKKTAEETPTTD